MTAPSAQRGARPAVAPSGVTPVDTIVLLDVVQADLTWTAAFLASKAFPAYRRDARGRAKTTVLPDFFIGAHAAVAGHTLLTRNPRRVRARFPTVGIVSPAPDVSR